MLPIQPVLLLGFSVLRLPLSEPLSECRGCQSLHLAEVTHPQAVSLSILSHGTIQIGKLAVDEDFNSLSLSIFKLFQLFANLRQFTKPALCDRAGVVAELRLWLFWQFVPSVS